MSKKTEQEEMVTIPVAPPVQPQQPWQRPVGVDVKVEEKAEEKVQPAIMPNPTPTVRRRPIDEMTLDVLERLGFERDSIPLELEQIYNRVKFYRDKITASRLTPGELALVIVLYETFKKAE